MGKGEADNAEQGLKPIIVKYQGKGENPLPSDNLYVKGLPGWVTEEDLREIFSKRGDIQSMKLKAADWGAIAFIRLANRKECARAILELNNTVPEQLSRRSEEYEVARREREMALGALKSVVAQLEKGVMVVLN